MRDLANKMAELKFEAPLAQFEETEDWGPVDFQSASASMQLKAALNDTLNLNLKEAEHHSSLLLLEEAFKETGLEGSIGGQPKSSLAAAAAGDSPNQNSSAAAAELAAGGGTMGTGARTTVDNFTEAFGGSLEDLVNTFDEKITKCFGNYETSVEELAPVQVRSQEEIMNECQMWWTITGNFGNILPIDWTKSYARQMHMPALQLGAGQQKHGPNATALPKGRSTAAGGDASHSGGDDSNSSSEEDEAVANDLDMHALILGGMQHMDTEQPIQTVEEVIKEIDDLMDERTPSDCEADEAAAMAAGLQREKSEAMEKAKEVLGTPLYAEKLQNLKTSQLNELYLEMEVLIREFSETLIAELALRDELEYEKELKNSFISLLLGVQNKRRQFHVQKKRGKAALLAQGASNKSSQQPSGLDPKYLTTVIPYHLNNGPPDNQALQVLIKILKAINEDSPTVPTLLTDYILKVLCPT